MKKAMKQCKTCGADIAKSAKVCPNCGAKNKKHRFIYVLLWVIVIMALLLLLSIDEEIDSDAPEDNATQVEQEEKKSAEEIAYDLGQQYFISIDWDSVFTYGATLHYIADYRFGKLTDSDYGKYVASCSAEIKNAFGAEFNSNVYLYMSKSGDLKHIFYEEADGSLTEIPIN